MFDILEGRDMRYLMKTNFMKKLVFAVVACIIILIIGLAAGKSLNVQAKDTLSNTKCFTSIEIQAGDSLWAIASRYADDHYDSVASYLEEICNVNHISGDMQIHAGEYIMIPYYL